MRTAVLASLTLVLLAAAATADAPRVVDTDLSVTFDPAAHRIEGTATLGLDAGPGGDLLFHLNGGLEISELVLIGAGKEEAQEPDISNPDDFWQEVKLDVPEWATAFRVRYSGVIYDAVEKAADLAFVIGDKSRGVISEEGIFLVAGSGWYPSVDELTVFRRVQVEVPAPFVAVTQGKLMSRGLLATKFEHTRWESDVPMDGLALQAGKYEVTTRQVGDVAISTYLFAADQEHAEFIIDEVERYLAFYRPILGEYPWPKFDIVANFFATGYGMPTYTLLGDTVIQQMVRMAPRYGGRIPPGFVDHELVHCWWGNFVVPDWKTGNWCEGLTTYCSNYLMKEVESEAAATAHRKKICTTFSIQVNPANDYPVRKFAGKTEDFENDIGYGKTAMLFHMLRRQVGSDLFFATLRRVIAEYGGKTATWGDFERLFSDAAGENLGWFFAQWLDRTGGPVLSAGDFTVARLANGHYEVKGEIRQEGDPWRLDVPVTVEHAGGFSYRSVAIDGARAGFTIVVPRPPLRVVVDEDFHVFRRLPLHQIQPCMNLTLARPEKVLVVPEGDTPYRALAEAAAKRKGGEIVVADDTLPATDCVLYGRPDENPAVAKVLAGTGVVVEGNSITVRGEKHEGEDLWMLVSLPHPEAEGRFVTVFLGVGPPAFARAHIIFYYGWDGYLVYSGRAPLARGDFTEIDPLNVRTSPLPGTADEAESHVRALTDEALGGRLAGTAGDAAARARLAGLLTAAGATDVREAPFTFTVRDFADPDAWTVSQGKLGDGETEWKAAFPGAVVPAIFSAPVPDGIRITSIVSKPEDADAGSLLMLPRPESPNVLMLLLASVADTEAAAIGIPMKTLETKDPALAGLAAYPSGTQGERPLLTAAGQQMRAFVPPAGLPCPVVFVHEKILPPGGSGDADAMLRIRFTERAIETANVLGTIAAPNAQEGAGPVLLSAHHDGLGEGHEGADDNASGVAAVLLAARALAERADLLGRPVTVAFFGAEEWGLMGSTAFAAAMAAPPAAVVNLDTVGAADAKDVYLIGRSRFPELSARAAECFEAEGFPIGRDIDKFAYAYGSDHWPFASRDIPALDLFSGQYRRMNSKDDVIGLVDFDKIARIGRAAARLVLDLAAED